MNLGNGKGPKHTGRSTTNVAPPTSLSTNFFPKTFSCTPRASCRESGTPRPTIDYKLGGIWISPFLPPIWPKSQTARMRKKVRGKVRGKPRTRSLPSLANPQVFPFHKLPRFWASAHARWKNKFANSSKPSASAASVRPRAETGKSWYEDSANESPPRAKSWASPTANYRSTASNCTPNPSLLNTANRC